MTDTYQRCNMTWSATALWSACYANRGAHVCHHHEAEMHVCACGSRTQGIVWPPADP